MKQSEMQSLVDTLARERKQHLTTIENITIRDLKDMVIFQCLIF
jgi:predicted hotdog family 3-hydroxylacyl-ACP dehydratase